MTNFPETDLAVLTSADVVVFPGTSLQMAVTKGPNIAAVKRAYATGEWLVALANRTNGISSQPKIDELAKVGVIGLIKELKTLKNGTLLALFEGTERFQVTATRDDNGRLLVSGAILPDRADADEATLESLRTSLQTTGIEILELLSIDSSEIIQELKSTKDISKLSHIASQYLRLPRSDAQSLLETISLKNRLLKILELLVARREVLKVQSKIQETLSESVGKKQREVILREQMKAIQDELGDGDEGPSTDDYRKRIDEAGLSEEARKVALREISRLERMGDQSAESHVIRNYLDLLCEMPWNKTSTSEINLEKAEEVLKRDHYGLDKIKKRILEHLSVMKLRAQSGAEKKGSILLFIGPPGVGKTSLGKSIAEALGRPFVRVSLGGVRDDADIRGHRRTYVGALPGRIVDGLKRAKTKDAVFVLDEIDKLGRGWGGDPASALLEVLDPEQNSTFHDHYLDVAFDLSEVFFIATANSRDTIPGPLLDRMEVIDLNGYTTDEKFHIAKDHLFAAELKNHGLQPNNIQLGEGALNRVIEGYTREAGVRSLRRKLAELCRGVAAKVAKAPEQVIRVDEEAVAEILGPARFEVEELSTENGVGVVTGMAWTPVGGDVLFVEAASIPGEGKVVVTGQLGDVMKESSQIAVAVAKARLESVVKDVRLRDRDIHLHVPGGAVPKDGPSAGVTMFTAAASLMLGVPVDPKIAMTGEITLRGKVLPVGGIKEKVLAAARFGVKEVILPFKNGKDLDELPKEIRSNLTFHLVSNVEELLQRVFGTLPSTKKDSLGNEDDVLTLARAQSSEASLSGTQLHQAA